jgi:branched-chain amino acid transport system substrate-binding protein
MLKTWLARCALLTVLVAGAAAAQDTIRIGLILPMTGPFASTGRQIDGAVKLWMQEHGSTVAGRKIEVIVKDDAGTPDTTRRLAQELVNDKVNVLAGFGLTPLALATAPIATQARVPMIVMAAATSSITEQSPMIVRSGFTLPQITTPLADWAAKNNIKKVITLVSDYGPGIDAENAFKAKFSAEGGQVTDSLRVPLRNPDFAPFLQKVKDEQPNAVFVFVPSGVGSIFAKQFVERGFDKSGVRLIATGDLTDDDILNDMGDVTLGVITSMHYSAAHPSAANKAYVEGFKKLNGIRPNFHSVGGYDGMRLIYMALEKTKGSADGEALVSAMKGLQFESPRGPVTIDTATRDPIQNVYLRKVEKQNGELWNVEFSTVPAVKDPMHK